MFARYVILLLFLGVGSKFGTSMDSLVGCLKTIGG